MVTNVTSFSRSGLSDFVVQRVSAVILAMYALCVSSFLLVNPDPSYQRLIEYFDSPSMVVFSTLAVGSFAAHAWVGLWTVGTDYIRPHYFGAHATAWRLVYQTVCIATLFVYTMWALAVIWRL